MRLYPDTFRDLVIFAFIYLHLLTNYLLLGFLMCLLLFYWFDSVDPHTICHVIDSLTIPAVLCTIIKILANNIIFQR